MFKAAFSGFSVNNQDNAKEFYANVLGLKVDDNGMGLEVHLPNSDATIFIYSKEDDHKPASFTVLNFVVEDIDATVDALTEKGIKFEHYEGFPFEQDEKGIARGIAANMGPDIAWFKDPAGNVLSVLQNA